FVEGGGAGAAHIEGEGDVAGDDVARSVFDCDFADRADRLRPQFAGDPLDRQHHLGEGGERIAPERHRRGAGMAGEAGEAAVVPDNALAVMDDADGLALGFEYRPLLNMQFDETAEPAGADRLAPAIADRLQRLSHRDA